MATSLEARPRFAIADRTATFAASLSHCVARVYAALNGTPHSEAPRLFAHEATDGTSALWILHAR